MLLIIRKRFKNEEKLGHLYVTANGDLESVANLLKPGRIKQRLSDRNESSVQVRDGLICLLLVS